MGHAGGVVTLEEDVLVLGVACVGIAVVIPRHDKTAVGSAGDGRLVLVAVGVGVDAELGAECSAVVAEALGVNTGTAAVLAIAAPGDDVAACAERGDGWLVLRVTRFGVDAEFRTHRHTLGVEALGIHTRAPAVLQLRLPHRDVATVDQACRRRPVLRIRPVGVHALVAKERRCAIGLWRDVDLHHARRAGAAVAVRQADAHRAAGHGCGRGVAVGQVFEHGLHGGHGGGGVEGDDKIGAVRAVAGDGADGHPAVADGVARHAHLPDTQALVAHAELVLQRGGVGKLRRLDVSVAGNDTDPQRAAVEIGAVGVDDAHACIDELGRRVDQIFCIGNRGHHVGEHRCGAGGDAAGRAQHGLEHAVGVVDHTFLVVACPHQHDVVAGQACDVRTELRAGHRGVDEPRPVHARAGCVELLRNDVVATAAQGTGALRVPGDDKAVVVHRGDARHGAAVGRRVLRADQQFAPHFCACCIEALGVDGVAGAEPGGNETAAGKCGHVGAVLVAGRGGVDGNERAELGTGVVEALCRDTVGAGVAAGVAPDSDEAAAGKRGQLRLELRGAACGVECDFGARGNAACRVALRQHVHREGVAGVVAAVGHQEAAVAQAQHSGLVLVADGGGGGAELGPGWRTGRIKALGVHAVAAAAVLAGGAPGDDKATAGQRPDGGCGLVVDGLAVDLEFGACGRAVGVEALREHTA